MKRIRRLNVITCIFLLCMVFFTLFSKDLYYLTLPKVLTGKARDKSFTISTILEDGTSYNTTTKYKAIPKVALRGNNIFVIDKREDGLYVSTKVIITGVEQDGWISIEEGVSSKDKLILGSDRWLVPGMKVLEVTDAGKKK